MNEPKNKTIFQPKVLIWVLCLFLIAAALRLFVLNPMLPHYGSMVITPSHVCINNLRQIDSAANQFALDRHKTHGEAIHFPDDLTPYIKLNAAGKIPGCPSGGTYTITKVGEAPKCSLGTTNSEDHKLPESTGQ